MSGDDEVTPTIDVEFVPPSRKWYAHKPGEGFTVIEGPANEPPVCEPCGKNTREVEDPVFPDTHECDGCGTTFTPADWVAIYVNVESNYISGVPEE